MLRLVTPRVALVAACASLMTLTACSGVYNPDVRMQRAGTMAVNTDIGGSLLIRDAFVVVTEDAAQAGATARLRILALNQTTESDTLLSVTTAAASQVTTTDSAVVPPAQHTGLDAGLGTANITASLEGLTKMLRGGDVITITLQFQHAGSATLAVPVVRGTDAFASYAPSPSPTPAA